MPRPAAPLAEFLLLALLALLWGSSYLFIKVAVAENPPITLIATRVSGAAIFLLCILWIRGERLPTDIGTWGRLGIQSFLNATGAWTVLAWGQQFVDAGLASVLNSTSPIFVFLFTAMVARRERLGGMRFFGACLGLFGVVLIVGPDTLRGLGSQAAGQIACLAGAVLYAAAAIHGRRFSHIGATATAAGTMIWATAVLVPAAFLFESPLDLAPSIDAVTAALCLSFLCTGAALLIYFPPLAHVGLPRRCEPSLPPGRHRRPSRDAASRRNPDPLNRLGPRFGHSRRCADQLASTLRIGRREGLTHPRRITDR